MSFKDWSSRRMRKYLRNFRLSSINAPDLNIFGIEIDIEKLSSRYSFKLIEISWFRKPVYKKSVYKKSNLWSKKLSHKSIIHFWPTFYNRHFGLFLEDLDMLIKFGTQPGNQRLLLIFDKKKSTKIPIYTLTIFDSWG